MEHKQYWPREAQFGFPLGFKLEARAEIAFRILLGCRYVPNPGISGPTLEDVVISDVSKAFQIADQFVELAEQRGELKHPSLTDDEIMVEYGRLDKLRHETAFPIKGDK